MNLTLSVKLLPTEHQATLLLATIERFNAACNFVAEVAFRKHTANKHRLQKACYYEVREKFGLSAQMTVRVIGKVSEAYKRDKSIQPKFRKHGAVVYDQRILSWKAADRVSILTLEGRELIPVVYGKYQQQRLKRVKGQADLLYRDGKFYLYVCVEVEKPPAIDTDDFLGVDLGIVNIAADSDGEVHSGGHLNGLRRRYARIRKRLQAKGTKSAKQLLAKRRHKEARFARNENHRISKRLVAKAKDTGRGISLEDLKGIRDRVTVRSSTRPRLPVSLWFW